MRSRGIEREREMRTEEEEREKGKKGMHRWDRSRRRRRRRRPRDSPRFSSFLPIFLLSLFLSTSKTPQTKQGFEIAKKHALAYLDDFKRPLPGGTDDPPSTPDGRDALRLVARTALRTKLSEALADALAGVVLDAVLTVRRKGEPIDLFMVEIMHMVREEKRKRDERLNERRERERERD